MQNEDYLSISFLVFFAYCLANFFMPLYRLVALKMQRKPSVLVWMQLLFKVMKQVDMYLVRYWYY